MGVWFFFWVSFWSAQGALVSGALLGAHVHHEGVAAPLLGHQSLAREFLRAVGRPFPSSPLGSSSSFPYVHGMYMTWPVRLAHQAKGGRADLSEANIHGMLRASLFGPVGTKGRWA